jgi:protein-disulfide isomerase
MEEGQKRNVDTGKLQACIKAQNDSAVKASLGEAKALGVEATPTLFVNGEKVDGALPLPQLRAVFDRALKEAGATPPAKSAASGAPGK